VPLFPPNGAEAQRAVQQANPVDCADAVLVALFRCMSYVRQEEIVKRDMNLALAILKTLEENKSPHLSEFDIESALKDAFDVSNRSVWYQLNLLADANLVRSMGSDSRLTWDGHEFLKDDLNVGNIPQLS
jgi:hypothetical protein